MDFVQQVGKSYLERKAYAAPQQLENLAKKQFSGEPSPNEKPQGSKAKAALTVGEDKEEVAPTTGRAKSTFDERDLEIARLKARLEESRRLSPSPKKAESRRRSDAASTVSTRKDSSASNRIPPSIKAIDGKGVKVSNGALVADAASRSHREKRPSHGSTTRDLGKTIDGKGIGVAGGALVAEKNKNRGRAKSTGGGHDSAIEPYIVEAAPRRRRGGSFGEASDRGSTLARSSTAAGPRMSRDHRESGFSGGAAASSARRRLSIADGNAPVVSTAHKGRSIARKGKYHSEEEEETEDESDHSSLTSPSTSPPAPHPPPSHQRRKPALSSRGRRPSTESDVGSVIAPRAQIESIRRRQRSRGRGLEGAEIDTPAPETPSLRQLSRRRREMELRHERGAERRAGSEGEDERGAVHLPERRKSVRRERVGEGEGSVVDVLEARSVPFRPHREGGGGGYRGEGRRKEKPRDREREGEREMAVVEVMEEGERRWAPTARKVEMGGRNGGRGEGRGVVEVSRNEGGKTVYRVR